MRRLFANPACHPFPPSLCVSLHQPRRYSRLSRLFLCNRLTHCAVTAKHAGEKSRCLGKTSPKPSVRSRFPSAKTRHGRIPRPDFAVFRLFSGKRVRKSSTNSSVNKESRGIYNRVGCFSYACAVNAARLHHQDLYLQYSPTTTMPKQTGHDRLQLPSHAMSSNYNAAKLCLTGRGRFFGLFAQAKRLYTPKRHRIVLATIPAAAPYRRRICLKCARAKMIYGCSWANCTYLSGFRGIG